jgi:hypothetical protein
VEFSILSSKNGDCHLLPLTRGKNANLLGNSNIYHNNSGKKQMWAVQGVSEKTFLGSLL